MRVLNRVPKSLSSAVVSTYFSHTAPRVSSLPMPSHEPVALMQFWFHTAHLPRAGSNDSNPLTNGSISSSSIKDEDDDGNTAEVSVPDGVATLLLPRCELDLSRRGASHGVLPKDLTVELSFKPWAMPRNQNNDNSGSNSNTTACIANVSSKAKALPRYFVKRSNGSLVERGKPVKGANDGMEMPKVPTTTLLNQTTLPSPPAKGAHVASPEHGLSASGAVNQVQLGNTSRWEPNFSIFGSSTPEANSSNEDGSSNSVPGDPNEPRQFGGGPKKTPANASWLEQATMGASSGVLAFGSLGGVVIGSTAQTHPEDEPTLKHADSGEKDDDDYQEDPINRGLKSLSSFSSGFSSFMNPPADRVDRSLNDRITEGNEEEATKRVGSDI